MRTGRPFKNGRSKSTLWRLTSKDVAFRDDFFSRVDQSAGTDGCWPWNGATNGRYGVFVKNMGREFAHRFSWMIANKADIPAGRCICHTCDNPKCVNPAHLWLGTQKQNVEDSIRKGRNSTPPYYYGESHHHGRRKACVNGHSFTKENTLQRKDAPRARLCRQCQIERVARRRERRHQLRATRL